MVRIFGLALALALIQGSFAAQLETCEGETCSSSAEADMTTLLQYNARSEESQVLNSTEGKKEEQDGVEEEEEAEEDEIEDGDEYRKEASVDEDDEEGEDFIEDGAEYRTEGSVDEDDEEEELQDEDSDNTTSLLQGSRRRFLVKQCVKNQALATMVLKTYNKKGEKMSQISNFMWLQEFCHKSKSNNNFRIFVLKPKSCKVAQRLAQGLVVSGVLVAFTAAAVLMAGGCVSACAGYTAMAQLAGTALETFLYAAHGEIMDALMSLPKSIEGIVLIPSNMKDGGKESAVTGDCLDGVIPGRMGSW